MLNPAQKEAVEHVQGPLLVLAGAGSGKTRVIAHRIEKLIATGVHPSQILAVSFTNKASDEMQRRMADLIGREGAKRLWLSTFHRFGVRFLSEEAEKVLGDKRFVIFDQGDSLGLLRELLRKEYQSSDRKLDLIAVQARISFWKSALIEPENVKTSDFEYDAVAKELYGPYQESLRAMRAFDFDDLVCFPARVLREREDIRAKWRSRFRHILIDEFQDTNHSQLELTKLLANELRNVCAVGDDDQSIYSWRGADIQNILQFEKHFPGAKVVKLEQNYRSAQNILDVANAVIANATGKVHFKTLRAARGAGDEVQELVIPDAQHEAKVVAAEIRKLAGPHMPYREIAVLYRSNTQAKLIEEELRYHDIPYKLLGGTQFFDRKEVKDAISFLRVATDPSDDLALRRIINIPPRGVGPAAVEKLSAFALAKGIPLFDALSRSEALDSLTRPTQQGVASIKSQITEACAALQTERPSVVAKQMLGDAGLRQWLRDQHGHSAGDKRYANVEHLIRSIERYESREGENKPSLAEFLVRFTLRMQAEEEEENNRVSLSTLHAAKGLEFRTVFLIGCVEGKLPHARVIDPKVTEHAPGDVEEERRLFYVGVTRAKDTLYLSRPTHKELRGQTTKLAPSRFLLELPEDMVKTFAPKPSLALEHDEIASAAEAILKQLEAP